MFLDTVRVRWWDTEARESREAIVPARRIDIALPERADLLAELALDGRSVRERVALHLASLGRRHAPWWVALGVLGVALSGLLLESRARSARRDPDESLPPL